MNLKDAKLIRLNLYFIPSFTIYISVYLHICISYHSSHHIISPLSMRHLLLDFIYTQDTAESTWEWMFPFRRSLCSKSVLRRTVCAFCPKLTSSLCLMVILTVKVLPKPNLFKESNSNELLLQCNTDNKFIQKITSTCCYFIYHASTMKTYLMDNFGKLCDMHTPV